jgi:hypothetical protein
LRKGGRREYIPTLVIPSAVADSQRESATQSRDLLSACATKPPQGIEYPRLLEVTFKESAESEASDGEKTQLPFDPIEDDEGPF